MNGAAKYKTFPEGICDVSYEEKGMNWYLNLNKLNAPTTDAPLNQSLRLLEDDDETIVVRSPTIWFQPRRQTAGLDNPDASHVGQRPHAS
jgi:hypothetical protein